MLFKEYFLDFTVVAFTRFAFLYIYIHIYIVSHVNFIKAHFLYMYNLVPAYATWSAVIVKSQKYATISELTLAHLAIWHSNPAIRSQNLREEKKSSDHAWVTIEVSEFSIIVNVFFSIIGINILQKRVCIKFSKMYNCISVISICGLLSNI